VRVIEPAVADHSLQPRQPKEMTMDQNAFLLMMIQNLIAEAKEQANDAAATRHALLTIKGADGPVTDGDIKNAFNVLAYDVGAANSGYGKGVKSGAATAFSDLLMIMDYDKALPTIMAKMTTKDKSAFDEVKLYFRNQSDTFGTVTLSKGSDSSVWCSLCHIIKFKNKANRPYLLIGFSYDVIEWAVGTTKSKFSVATNSAQ
jgi:hypothetical protein